MCKKIILAENEVIKMIDLWKSNTLSIKEIGMIFGFSSIVIYRILKENGIDFENRKYKVNHNYFEKIDTEEKAYWLGFLYADGYVRIHKQRSGQLKLKLKKMDIEHIEKFKNTIESTQTIDSYISKVKVNNKTYESEVSEINIYSTKMVNDLFNNGCINKKSDKIIFPNIDTKLISHFIRGYFDGDGSISIGKYHITLNFVSGSYKFLEEIKKEFEKLKILNCKIAKNKAKCWYISWQKINDIEKIYNYLYKNSNINLNRKKLKFDYIFNHEYEINENIKSNLRKRYKLLK